MGLGKQREPISFALLVGVVGLALGGVWTGYYAYQNLSKSYKFGAKSAEIEAKRDDMKKNVPKKHDKMVDAAFESKIRKRERLGKRFERKGYDLLKWAVGMLLTSGVLGLVRRRWMMHLAIRGVE